MNTPYVTYETANIHIIWMNLSARRALDFEGVPEGIFRSVIRSKFTHPISISMVTMNDGRILTDPVKSAVRVRVSIFGFIVVGL